MSYNKISPILLLAFTIGLHITAKSHTTSKVTNNTSKSFHVYWTAAGCAGVKDGVSELCKRTKVGPHSYATYRFGSSKTNIQVKVQLVCVSMAVWQGGISHIRNRYSCPSASGHWIHDTNDSECKLKGKGRGHVKNVVINDFEKPSVNDSLGACP